MRAITLLAVGIALMTPAFADDAKPSKPQFNESTIADITCLYVAISVVESADPSQKQAGMMANLYWLGKLAAVDPNLTGVEDILMADTTQVKGDFFKKEAIRCGTEMEMVGKRESDLGADLIARSKRLQQTQ